VVNSREGMFETGQAKFLWRKVRWPLNVGQIK